MEIDDGPTQEAIDFINQMNDEQVLEEFHFIHEESEKINEHGLGISQMMINDSILSLLGFDMNGLPLELNT